MLTFQGLRLCPPPPEPTFHSTLEKRSSSSLCSPEPGGHQLPRRTARTEDRVLPAPHTRPAAGRGPAQRGLPFSAPRVPPPPHDTYRAKPKAGAWNPSTHLRARRNGPGPGTDAHGGAPCAGPRARPRQGRGRLQPPVLPPSLSGLNLGPEKRNGVSPQRRSARTRGAPARPRDRSPTNDRLQTQTDEPLHPRTPPQSPKCKTAAAFANASRRRKVLPGRRGRPRADPANSLSRALQSHNEPSPRSARSHGPLRPHGG